MSGLTRWTWRADVNAFLPELPPDRVVKGPPTVKLSARVASAPLLLPRGGAGAPLRLLATDVRGRLTLLQGGLLTIEAGLVQGLGAELVFALFLYRNWRLPVAMLAGAGAGLAMAINDLVIYYAGAAPLFTTTYIVSGVVGGALIAGGLSWLAVRGLAKAGALDRFAAGRERREV